MKASATVCSNFSDNKSFDAFSVLTTETFVVDLFNSVSKGSLSTLAKIKTKLIKYLVFFLVIFYLTET